MRVCVCVVLLQPSYGVSSNNPILRNITDYLIEEASAEEEELLGVSASSQQEPAAGADTIERDDELIKVTDGRPCRLLPLVSAGHRRWHAAGVAIAGV